MPNELFSKTSNTGNQQRINSEFRQNSVNFSQEFFLKHRLVVMKLSRDLLAVEPGQQLQTIDYYIEQFSVSRGTIQMAMQFLIANGCISTEFRGHLGTYLISKNKDKLWEFAGIGTLTGSMPIPLDIRASGFATGICDCMRTSTIPFNCIFIHGSQARINGLMQGRYDFTVVTRLAEETSRKKCSNIEMVMDLPGCQYTEKYVYLFKNPKKTKIEDGMTVALDPTSVDQAHLIKAACKNRKKIVIVQAPSFLNTRLSITSGEADVTVITTAVANALSPEYQGHVKELSLPNYTKKDIERLSMPVVLILKDNYGMDILLKRILRASSISNSLRGVMDGTLPSNFY